FARLILREFNQVASIKKITQALFLVACEQFCSLQFVQELFGRALGRVEIEPFFEIAANSVGHQNAKFARLTKQRQGLLEFLIGPHVGWNDRHNRRLSGPLWPVTLGTKQYSQYRHCTARTTDKTPAPR